MTLKVILTFGPSCVLYMIKPKLYDQYFGHTGIKSHFDMILTFDFEDHMWILFLVVDYIVVNIKLNQE